MDRSLDDIISERPRGGGRIRPDRRGGPPPRAPRSREEYPRDGVRKNRRDDNANIEGDWVHDRYDDNDRRRRDGGGRFDDYDGYDRRAPAGRAVDNDGTRLRVDNLHYELTEDDVNELFTRIGPVAECKMQYDRMDRSTGGAWVTYVDPRDAREAVRQFDGANANGQPIKIALLPSGPSRGAPAAGGSLFDRVQYPSRSLEERISRDEQPRRRGGRQDRSFSPRKERGGLRAPGGVDSYVPGGRVGRDSRSPLPGGRERGRRPGERRERGGRGGGRGGRADEEGRPAGGRRPRKTAEELDAEMEDYFGGGGSGAAANGNGEAAAANGGGAPAAAAAAGDDVDMIE